MKLLDKLAKKFTKSASSAVKTEVKKTAVDLLPSVIGAFSMVLGIVIFKGSVGASPSSIKPTVSTTHITTNNYFFQNLSEEMIRKIIERK